MLKGLCDLTLVVKVLRGIQELSLALPSQVKQMRCQLDQGVNILTRAKLKKFTITGNLVQQRLHI